MLAAAMESDRPSPLMIPSWGREKFLTRKPSIRQWSGKGESASAARRMAKWVAWRIFSRSISSRSAMATAHEISGLVVICW
jgi:hypothetical protein